jgi:DNA polymerase (family 10)
VGALPDALETLGDFALLRGEHALSASLADAARQLRALEPRTRHELVREVCQHPDTRRPGLAPDATSLVRRVVEEGRGAVLAAARARLAPDLARLLAVPGVSLKDVVAVHRRTGAVTAGDLAGAVSTIGHPAVDVDEELRMRIEAALPSLRVGHPRLALGRAVAALDRVCQRLHGRMRHSERLEIVGSVRRSEPTIGDLALLVSTTAHEGALREIQEILEPPTVLHRGPRRLSLVTDGEVVTVHAVSPDEFPCALLYYTGSAAHVRALQTRAAARGGRLSASGLQLPGATASPCRTEADVYEALGLDYVPPELRHGDWELQAAAATSGAFASLLTTQDIRGDLHTHTLWSDGRDSVDMMVRAAAALGYEYVAITDHSQRAAASRVLTIERLERQRDEIERVRRRQPGIRVLHGAEVDILPDGALDFPDTVLDHLDIVLASLHEPAGQPPDMLLRRYVQAMHHPKVHIITHPANRMVGRSEGYALDYPALFAAAVATGTVLEVDGGPAHLDMDGHIARDAVRAGVLVSVDSDCHNAARLRRQMAFGVATARRGGLRAHDVLNTRPLSEVLAQFAAKPARLHGLEGL